MRKPDPHADALDRAVARYADQERRETTEHPSEELLIAYADERLDGERREAVEMHLALCASCRETVLEARQFIAPDAERDEAPDALADAARDRLIVRLRQRESESGDEAARASFRRRPSRWPWGLAATFAMTTLGLALMRIDAGDPNTILVGLEPGIDRTVDDLPEVRLTSHRWIVLVLGAEGRDSGDLVLYDAEGSALHTMPHLVADGEDRFVVRYPAHRLEPGPMTFRVLSRDFNDPLEYKFRVVASDEAPTASSDVD